MTQSRPRNYWQLIAIACWYGVLSSALIAFVICSVIGFSLILHNERLQFTIPRMMADDVHVMLNGGQLQIGTQIDVPDISDWVRHVRVGTAEFGYPVTGTFNFHYGRFQLSWIRFAEFDPTFGFACPVLAILVPVALMAWVMYRLRRYALRRTKADEEDSESIPSHGDAQLEHKC